MNIRVFFIIITSIFSDLYPYCFNKKFEREGFNEEDKCNWFWFSAMIYALFIGLNQPTHIYSYLCNV